MKWEYTVAKVNFRTAKLASQWWSTNQQIGQGGGLSHHGAGLEPRAVAGAGIQGDDLQCSADMVVQSNDDGHFWVFFWIAVLFLLWAGFIYKAWKFAKHVSEELSSHS
jgi:hypothetical protein